VQGGHVVAEPAVVLKTQLLVFSQSRICDRLIDFVERNPIEFINGKFLFGPLILFRLFIQRQLELAAANVVYQRYVDHIHETVDQFNDRAFDGFGLFVDLFFWM
jgi:hypothetical protein